MFLEIEGHRLFVHRGGVESDDSATLPTLVLLHGAGMDHTVWVFLSRYFAHRGWRVLAPDLPGHGRSPGPPLETIEEMAGLVRALLAAFPSERRVLAGHSMGALVALSAAGGSDAELILLGAAAEMPVHPDLLELAKNNDPLAGQLVTAWGHGPSAQIGGHPASGLWLMGSAESLLAAAPPGVLHNDLAACAAFSAGLDAAGKVAGRALVVAGDGDKMTPAKAGKALAGAIPGATFHCLSDSGHMMMVEAPRATLLAVRKFLEAA